MRWPAAAFCARSRRGTGSVPKPGAAASCQSVPHPLPCRVSLPLHAAPTRPAHALHFAVYEKAKALYGGHNEGYQVTATAAAGATATVVNDAIMTPVDVVKQRLQVGELGIQGAADVGRACG